jgi:hypothetical protein
MKGMTMIDQDRIDKAMALSKECDELDTQLKAILSRQAEILVELSLLKNNIPH